MMMKINTYGGIYDAIKVKEHEIDPEWALRYENCKCHKHSTYYGICGEIMELNNQIHLCQHEIWNCQSCGFFNPCKTHPEFVAFSVIGKE